MSVPATGYALEADQSKTTTAQTKSTTASQPSDDKDTKTSTAATDKATVTVSANAESTPIVSVKAATPVATISTPASTTPKTSTASAPQAATPAADAAASDAQKADANSTTTPTATAAPEAGAIRQTNVQNNTESTATTGTASVINNVNAGNATSGNASATATVVTVVGSGTGLGASPVTFTQNIYNTPGSNEIQGNITIDPNSLALVNGSGAAGTSRLNLAQGSVSMTEIENNITLAATSGDANVADNGEAGNATSGDAVAMANIMNIVSSSVGASRSFLGVVNIFGNLKGDILVPASFVDSLFATNGSSATTPSGNSATSSTINITNNVNLSALSGTATVANNGEAGNATSGDAMTNLTVFNLTGREVVAKNSLLVFVNVMGKWVGMIVNAPAGSTAAALGGGVRSDDTTTAAPGNHSNNTTITNNVSVSATSGNASVTGNGEAGNATSGSTKAGANILNFVHSSFNLDDWFGALFINVIGSWLGNFDIAKDTPTESQPAPTTPTAITPGAIESIRAYQFNDDMTVSAPVEAPTAPADDQTDDSRPTDTVLASTTKPGTVLGSSTASPQPALPQFFGQQDMVSFLAMVSGIALLTTLAIIVTRRRRQAAA